MQKLLNLALVYEYGPLVEYTECLFNRFPEHGNSVA